ITHGRETFTVFKYVHLRAFETLRCHYVGTASGRPRYPVGQGLRSARDRGGGSMRNPKMTKKSLNVAAGLLAVAAITAAGASAASAEENNGDNDVEVAVCIPQTDTPGVLAMTVAADSTTLTENGSDRLHRRFTGAVAGVTVTDARDGSELPAGAGWYVLGPASGLLRGR